MDRNTTMRMVWWREYKWLWAQRFIGWAMALIWTEASRATLLAFQTLIEGMAPDDYYLTVKLQPRSAAALFAKLAAAERLTDEPAEARYTVLQEDGQVRLVTSGLFQRDGDVVHARGTPGFDQAVRYWRIDRNQREARGAA